MTAVDLLKLAPRIILATPSRLFAIYVSLFCAAVAGVFIYVNFAMLGFLNQEAEASVKTDQEALVARYGEGGLPALVTAISERATSTGNSLYLLTDGKGRWLAGNLDTIAANLWESQGEAQFSYRKRVESKTDSPAFGIVSRLPGDLHLVVARDIESQEALKRLLRRAFLLGYALIFGIGAAGAVIVSRRMLHRVDAASNTARQIMQGNLNQRIPMTGRDDEFDRLSQNLNAMLDRIQDLMAGLKNVSDNIAHDLKTPLHRLRTRAERALQSSRSPDKLSEALGTVIEEADGLIQTFDALLSIARLEAGSRSESFGPLNVCALIRDVAELYEPAAEERGLSVRLSCPGDVIIAGEKHLIGQALVNLLDNAIKYAAPSLAAERPPGVQPGVEIGLEDRAHSVDIIVSDTGPGIPAEDRERVLQRFVRLQPERSIPGSGLGLSLVAAVARLHDGSVALEDNSPGLRVRLTFKKNLSAVEAVKPPEVQTELSHAS